MALEVNSVPLSDTIICGLPRTPLIVGSSRAPRLPEIDGSGIAARHSRVTSSTMLRMRKRRPRANWSWTKSSDQRALALASTDWRPCADSPPARLALADGEAFLAIEAIDPVQPGGLALPSKKH